MNTHSPSTEASTLEPDQDAIKMFVGQIPRCMDESELRNMFEEFGPVFQINVLRDKVTGQSKGCCFITFYTRKSALEAQNKLHNMKTLTGMQHPIQMKPADSEKRNIEERKLFVGMLSKRCSESDVRTLFSQFGQIEECTVLREQNGSSKGCAFVTFSSKQNAQNCIKSMHHSQTMEGCRYPLVVKFADTQKEKEMKKFQQVNSNLLQNIGGLNGLNLTPQYLALLQQMANAGGSSQQSLGSSTNFGNLGLGLNALQMQHILTATASAAAALQNNPALTAALANLSSTMNNSNFASMSQSNGHNSNSSTPNSGTGDVTGMQNLQQLQGLATLAALATNPTALATLQNPNVALLQQLLASAAHQGSGQQGVGGSVSTSSSSSSNNASLPFMSGGYTPNTLPNMGGSSMQVGGSHVNGMSNNSQNQVGSNSSSQPSAMDTINQAYTGIQQYAGQTQMQQASSSSPAGKQTEGPDGANLFIYHLPQEFSDHDLLQMFLPFGSVVSSKVFIDKQTNLSKCFGFVSYDNAVSAQAAIQAMNGFQIGMKRLKVQLKRPKGDSKPY